VCARGRACVRCFLFSCFSFEAYDISSFAGLES